MSASTTAPSPPIVADELTPVLSSRWALTWRHLAVCLLFGGMFLYANCRPLSNSAAWLHICKGRAILAHRTLPLVDASQSLSEGMRVVDGVWLSEILLALADGWGGPQYVANLFALVELAGLIVLARVFYLQTGRVGLMALGVGMVVLLGSRLQPPAGPEVFGGLCFAVLLWIITKARLRPARWHWPAVALLFAAWANLHGSFLLGIVVLVCLAVGEAVEVAWRTKRSGTVRRWTLLAECALVASLLNPYGPNLLAEYARLLGNTNVRSLPLWLPPSLPTPSGVLFLTTFAILAVVMRHSRRRVAVADVLLLAVFAAAAVPTAPMLAWYAVVFIFVMMPHVADMAARMPHGVEAKSNTPTRGFGVSLVCVLVVWAAFAMGPISQGLLGGKPREVARIVGSSVPHGVAEHFSAQPPQGLVFAPTAWADWLALANGPNFPAYMTSDVQWVPRRVYSDYVRMARAEFNWERGMDRYGVETLVIDKKNQWVMHKAIARSSKWRVDYEDDTALVARRVWENELPDTYGCCGGH